MNPNDVADRLATGGTAGLIAGLVFALFAVVLGYQTRWIVPGWMYKETKSSEKSWQTLAENQGDKIERMATLVETQQKQIDKQTERSEQTTKVAESNATKLDRILLMLESRPRASR